MINVFKKVWNFSKKEKPFIKRSIIAGFLNAVFNALQIMAIFYTLTVILENKVDTKDIFISFGILFVSLIGQIWMQNISQMAQTHAGYFMVANERIDIGNKLKKVPMGFFSEYSLGKLTTMSTTTLNSIEMQVPMILVLVLGGFLNTLVFVLAMFIFNIKIGAVAFLGMFAFLIITNLMENRSRKNAKDIEIVGTEMTKEVLSTILGMQIIKSYNLGGENNKKLNNTFHKVSKVLTDMELRTTPYIAAQRIALSITTSIMMFLSVILYFSGEMLLTETIVSMISGFIIFNFLKGAGSSIAILRILENLIDSLGYLRDMPEMKEGEDNSKFKDYEINFKNVSFSYEDKKILDNISCSIKEGEITAIIGPSGSGKTTMCNLISRFWDVDSGTISIGNQDIRNYTLQNLMSNISMVFQNVYLFEDTIENNIRFANPRASREEVIEAAKKAMCHDFINNLPDGYNTIIGEGGMSLSGGEKQRISIARAILKDAPIVIFDEATANIDPENEDKLRIAIEELTKNKTIIMIAHRLKTIRNANQILVLNKGKIQERGTHDELMEKDGLYKKLVEIKNEEYSWKLNN